LPPPLWQAPVGADDTVPWEVIVDGRQNVPHESRRRGVDVAIGADKSSGDCAYPGDDAIGPRLNAGLVRLCSAARIGPAISGADR
jgi:hypothetical protein